MSLAEADRAIARLAATQHGVVAREQLTRLGISRAARAGRVGRGLLHPLPGCPGAFAVGHAGLSLEGRLLGVVLAAGPGAHVTGEHGDRLWGLRAPWLPEPGSPVSLVVPRDCGRVPAAAMLCRRHLPPVEQQRRLGVPVVSVPRLVLDACATRELLAAERLLDRALGERRTSLRSLEAQLARAGRQRGAPGLRRLLAAERRYAGLTRSELEEAFLALLRRAGIELPAVNERLGSDLVDALFALAGVVVELDGTWWHRTRRRQDEDRRRELRLRARGLLVLRYTARQLFEESEAIVADLVRALAERTAGRGAVVA
jgi:very-short-patch-repair endonuclease